ncbi:alpha/beta hydrolase-fold protein [Actinomadura fulvescens]|uniref:Alpha/beta hydrolase-fold protein n=1 Tax=Actinomadura fulvescens TaxID=46160 RepID=A0ABN3PPF6_9ACTN
MGLTSGGLLGLLSLITIACLAGTVRAWPRLADAGLRTTAMRAGLLAAGQLMIILTLLVGVNGYYLFYGTWSDLIGAAGGDAQVRQHPPAGSGADAAAATRVVRTVQAKLGPRDGAKPGRDGQVQHLEIHGVRSGVRTEAYVYLPPEYFQPEHATKRFPVALFIAGYPSRDRLTWIEKGRLPEEVVRQRAAGRIQPMIYVMMRPTVEPGWDTECADVPGGPKVETFFAQDVPEAISDTYRAARSRQGWGVAGYSAGGYCAVKLAMLHSDRFTAAASLAGHFRAILDTTTRQLYDRSKQLRQDNDLLWRLRNLPQPPVSVLVASAAIGEKTYPQATAFMRTARPPLLVDKVLLPTGGHNFKTFRKYIPPTIEWLSARLRGEAR